MAVPLWLDHVSLSVPNLRDASALLDTRLGLRATVSCADPDHHGRVYLDHAYLEVSAREPVDRWAFSLFCLRFDDPERLRDHLVSAGLPYRFGSYAGVDGRWDDVELDAGSVPLPILVRRTHPPEIAVNWPPALDAPHRCGARTLEAVHMIVPDLAAATDAYTELIGTEAIAGIDGAEAGHATFALTSGRIVLSQGLRSDIVGIVLGVSSLTETVEVTGPLTSGRVAWIDPATLRGVRVGFQEF